MMPPKADVGSHAYALSYASAGESLEGVGQPVARILEASRIPFDRREHDNQQPTGLVGHPGPEAVAGGASERARVVGDAETPFHVDRTLADPWELLPHESLANDGAVAIDRVAVVETQRQQRG